jgi:dihydrofolate synthase / folylpolyglutamate synthase
MTYAETLDYIFHKLPMYSRIGSAAYKKDLHNIRTLCGHLGNPHHQFRSIHIAGTNGKGSVSHMLAAIFQTAGYKTGLYTSPHLYDFRERIRLNGEMIPEEYVISFVEQLKPLIEAIEPSFFEITVAMAFQFFAEQKVDIAMVEVGLGGRLDSTNIIRPELSIITNIGYDHMNILGDSLEKIAFEKGGIIKEAVPVVIGETRPETKPVFQKLATERKAPLVWAEDFLAVEKVSLDADSLSVCFNESNHRSFSVKTDLTGIYQVQNVRTVLTAAGVLNEKGWNLDANNVLSALKEVKKKTGLGGRWEVVRQKPTIVLEVAHNEDGIRRMTEHIGKIRFDKLHIIIGMVKDKEVEKVLGLLPKNAQYYFTQAAIPRALPAAELKQKAEGLQLNGEIYDNVNLALDAAKKRAGEDDLIIICGSIFLVAEVTKT